MILSVCLAVCKCYMRIYLDGICDTFLWNRIRQGLFHSSFIMRTTDFYLISVKSYIPWNNLRRIPLEECAIVQVLFWNCKVSSWQSLLLVNIGGNWNEHNRILNLNADNKKKKKTKRKNMKICFNQKKVHGV